MHILCDYYYYRFCIFSYLFYIIKFMLMIFIKHIIYLLQQLKPLLRAKLLNTH